jgi:tripartite-type tricarboxylate transporter receptor subunit TctC
MKALRNLIFSCGAVLIASLAIAQDYPGKPVRILVGFPPGAGTDLVGRLVADQLSKSLGSQFLVVNTVGASGAIAAGTAAKSEPDGYTLLLAATPLTLTPQLNKSMPYDALKSFTPIARIAESPLCVVVQAESPLQSIADIITMAKAKPGALNYGSGGTASTSQFAGELLRVMAKVDIQNVAYTGLPAAVAAVLGGQIQMAFTDLPPALGPVRAGRLRMIAVTSAQRVAMLPSVPTVAESGVPGYQVAVWYGLAAPAGLPKPVLDKLQGAIVGALGSPEKALVDQFAAIGVVPVPVNTPEQFAEFLRNDFAFWKKLAADIGVKPN